MPFWVLTLACLGLAVVSMAITAVAARVAGRVSVVDTTWGIALTGEALLCALLGDGDPLRRWLLLGLVAVWGLRLSWYVAERSHGKGEDPRYRRMMEAGPGGPLLRVWVPQGAAVWLVSLPLQVSAVTGPGLPALVGAGAAVWLLGVCFEVVGDAQMAAYKQDPDRGPVMDRGLWAWTRHPNYFGDACVWWGLWLVAASAVTASWWVLPTVVSPLAMTWFLAFVTGARLLERTVMADRPGYAAYSARTSMLFPLPPRRARSPRAN